MRPTKAFVRPLVAGMDSDVCDDMQKRYIVWKGLFITETDTQIPATPYIALFARTPRQRSLHLLSTLPK